MRIGIAAVMQETNTFAPGPCDLDAFTIRTGDAALAAARATNTEFDGAVQAVVSAGAEAVPTLWASALPAGRLADAAFVELAARLGEALRRAMPLDSLVLSLHGSLATETCHDADAALLAAAHAALGRDVPIAVTLDLHANVTQAMVDAADAIVGYHTDPHVDMANTGTRAARLAVSLARGDGFATALAKRPMLIPAETMSTVAGPIAEIRRAADAATTGPVVDVSLFPVQPWLDVPELGFGVLVTMQGEPGLGGELAERFATMAWDRREQCVVRNLLPPERALAAARRSAARPFLLVESADAPTAGAAGDSAAMVAALRDHAPELRSCVAVVDAASVAACTAAGVGSELALRVGASIDPRFHPPVDVAGTVALLGDGEYALRGATFTGTTASLGRFAVVRSANLQLLLTERPAVTADPATFVHVGIDVDDLDVLVVKSCSDYRANYATAGDAVILDVPGPSAPRLEGLRFTNAPRPLWPLDPSPLSGDRSRDGPPL